MNPLWKLGFLVREVLVVSQCHSNNCILQYLDVSGAIPWKKCVGCCLLIHVVAICCDLRQRNGVILKPRGVVERSLEFTWGGHEGFATCFSSFQKLGSIQYHPSST